MTVAELIEHLKTLPQDAVVLYQLYSDFAEMSDRDISLAKAEEELIVWREANGYSGYNALWFKAHTEKPDFRTAVIFPGN